MNEFMWYQCTLKTASGKELRGVRGIAKSYDLFKKRIEEHVEDILSSKGLPLEIVIDEVNVELVDESILNRYNLNNIKDYNRFLHYLDDNAINH